MKCAATNPALLAARSASACAKQRARFLRRKRALGSFSVLAEHAGVDLAETA